ncbi:MAG: LytR/AlgR family response regulator transcription factor [Acidobacteriota bacterium]
MSSLKWHSNSSPTDRAPRPAPLGLVGPAPAARLSAWVADGESQARAALVGALERAGILVAGESASGVETLEGIRRARASIALLAVDLPGLSGFDVLEALAVLERGERPAVVFVTSDPRDAARAFEDDAADCIVKPFSPERIAAALTRARGRAGEAVEPKSPARRLEEWLLVKKEGRCLFIRVAEIDWIESARNNVILHVGGERYVHHETTSGIEARLSPNRFLRIHRSAIVRIDRIKELVPWFNGDYRVILKDGTPLTLSEGYRDRLKRFRA